MKQRPPLSDLEREIMNVLWRHGKATAADVQKSMADDRVLKDSTIRTLLTRMEEKGYVEHEVDGRTYVYSPVEKADSVAARAVKQIVETFCDGSLESLLAGMVQHELVDVDELQEIADRFSRMSKGAKKRK